MTIIIGVTSGSLRCTDSDGIDRLKPIPLSSAPKNLGPRNYLGVPCCCTADAAVVRITRRR
jgi:hypothetical protein